MLSPWVQCNHKSPYKKKEKERRKEGGESDKEMWQLKQRREWQGRKPRVWAASGNWKRQGKRFPRLLRRSAGCACGLLTSKIICNLCCFKPLDTWQFTTKVVENSTLNLGLGGSYFFRENSHKNQTQFSR